MNRRVLVSTMAAVVATVGVGLGGTSSAWAQSKEIVYITPGLDLPFWRYLSKGIEAAAKKGGYTYQALDFSQQRRHPTEECAGRHRARGRGHRDFADRQFDGAQRSGARGPGAYPGRGRRHRHQ